jgi:hypothetical protein
LAAKSKEKMKKIEARRINPTDRITHDQKADK